MTPQEYFAKALECNALKDKKGAIANYTQAIKLNSNYAKAYNNRGNIVYELSLEKRFLCKIANKFAAITDYIRAILSEPSLVESYINIGVVCSSMTAYLTAIDHYNKAIEINSSNFVAYCYRGMAYEKLGQYEAAMENYNKAIEINPSYIEAYVIRAVLHNRLEDTQKAIDDCTKAIEINPKYAQAYFVRSVIRYNAGDEKNGVIDNSHSVLIDHENCANIPEEVLLEIEKP